MKIQSQHLLILAATFLGLAQPCHADPVSLDPSERLAALTVMSYRMEQLKAAGGPEEAMAQKLLEFAKTLPPVDSVAVQADGVSVSGKFKDGVGFALPSMRSFLKPGQAQPKPQPPAAALLSRMMEFKAPAAPPRPVDFPPTVLPGSKQVRLLAMQGDSYDAFETVRMVGDWFNGAGYKVIPPSPGDTRLSALRQIAGDAVLYWSTHGGPTLFSSSPVTGADGQAIHMETDDYAKASAAYQAAGAKTSDHFKENKDDIAAHYVSYSYGVILDENEKPVNQWNYTITPNFIRHYWYQKLAPHAIVYLDVCQTEDADLLDALKDAGAEIVLDWQNDFNGNFNVARYFFDRLLSANKHKPLDVPNRPFDTDAVFAAMESVNKTHQPNGGVLTYHRMGPRSVLLVPTIYEITSATEKDSLQVWGLFGDTAPTKVTAGSQILVCNLTHPYLLTCPLPTSAGDIVVENDGRFSNPVLLERWQVHLSFTFQDDDSPASAEVDAVVDGDGHGPRKAPEVDPEPVRSPLSYDSRTISGTVTINSDNEDHKCHGSASIAHGKSVVGGQLDMSRDPAHRWKWNVDVGGVVDGCSAGWRIGDDVAAYATVDDDLTVHGGSVDIYGDGTSVMKWGTFKAEAPVEKGTPR